MTDFDRDNSHYPKPAPCGAEHRGEADELAADPANAALKRQLLDEAMYFDDLHDRAAPMPDDMDG
jgi:hypothetical protein